MSLGQTMISIATLVALTIMVVTSQRYLIEGQKDSLSSECLDLASGAAESLLAEIARKDFDVTMTYTRYQATTEFTPAGSLGPSSLEHSQVPSPDTSSISSPFKSISSFNDIDDYDSYVRTIDTDLIKGISLTVKVFYVAESNMALKVGYTTYYKRVEVTAQQSTYLSPVTFSIVISY